MTRPPRWSRTRVARRSLAIVARRVRRQRRHRERRQRSAAPRGARPRPVTSSRPGGAVHRRWPTRSRGEAPCGQTEATDPCARPVHGQLQEDHGDRRADRRVPALRPGRRVPVARSRSARSASTTPTTSRHMPPTSRTSTSRTAPAPTSSASGARATGSSSTANDAYWGSAGADAERRVPLERRGRAALARAPDRHRRRHRQPGHRRHPDHQGRLERHVLPARRPEHLLPRLQQHDQAVGQREGPPGDRAWASTAQRIVDNFYPEGSEVATHFTPCVDPVRLRGRGHLGLRPRRGQGAAGRGPGRGGHHLDRHEDPVPRRRPRLPPRPARRSRPRSRASSRPTSASTPRSTCRSRARSSTPTPRARSTASSCSAGAPTIPDATNFLDYHFGSGSGTKFGEPFPDIVAALNTGGQTADDAVRARGLRGGQQPHQGARPGRHRRARRLRHRLQGGRRRAPTRSPLSNEIFSVMKAGDRDTLVWMQNAEPLSLYCGDETDGETLRACEQIKESLYALRDRRHGHRAGARRPTCTPERRPDDLDLHAPRRRDLPRRRDARRQRRRGELRGAVGRAAPAAHRPLGRVRVLPRPLAAASSTRRRRLPNTPATRVRTPDRGAAPRRPCRRTSTRTSAERADAQ